MNLNVRLCKRWWFSSESALLLRSESFAARLEKGQRVRTCRQGPITMGLGMDLFFGVLGRSELLVDHVMIVHNVDLNLYHGYTPFLSPAGCGQPSI